MSEAARLDVEETGERVRVRVAGPLNAVTITSLWSVVEKLFLKKSPSTVEVDASGISFLDGAGAALLLDMNLRTRRGGGEFSLTGLSEDFQHLLDLYKVEDFEQSAGLQERKTSLPEETGRAVAAMFRDMKELITFVGELLAALVISLLNPRSIRWRDTIRLAETSGANALPIICLIGFLIGLIMAFQSAIPMKQFGAEIFVADLVSLSMLRELGPLMTAIVLAGRSGSAFAAEIGTMKVNEEISALTTFGLDPVRFLVVPRVIAAIAMTPLLAVFLSLAGLVGGGVVMLSLDFPLITYLNKVHGTIDLMDFLGGMIKAFFFGILVAGIGCLRGLQTKTGASAVGDSTTRSVVSGIVLIAIADGIFSVLYYYMDI